MNPAELGGIVGRLVAADTGEEDRLGIRRLVATPGDMEVGSDQKKPVAVEFAQGRRRFDNGKRNSVPRGRGLESADHRVIPIEGEQRHGLADQVVHGVRQRGYEVLGEPNAGIVSFRKPGIDSATICAHLRERSVVTAQRAGWVRTSPHFYITPEEIEKMLDLLP